MSRKPDIKLKYGSMLATPPLSLSLVYTSGFMSSAYLNIV